MKGPAGYGTAPSALHSLGHGHGENSFRLTAGLLIADMVGTGILSMGIVMKQFGWALGIFMTVAAVMFNNHIGILLYRVRQAHPMSPTMGQLAYNVYKDQGDGRAHSMKTLTTLVQGTHMFSMLGMCSLTAGKALGMLFYDVRVCLPSWSFIGCMIIFPFIASTQSLGGWSSLVFLNIVTIMGSVAMPLAHFYSMGSEHTRATGASVHPVADFDISKWFAGTSALMFACSSQVMLVEILAEMRDPREFPHVFTGVAAPFLVIMFTIVGCGSYYFKGDRIEGMIIDSMAFGLVFRCAAATLLTHMVISFLIKGVVVVSMLKDLTTSKAKAASRQARGIPWVVIALTVLVFSWVSGQAVPFFDDLVDLVGASLTPLSCFVLPLLYYLHFDRATGFQHTSCAERFAICLELVFSVILLFVGTSSAMARIALQWETYGYPFQCHCEALWNSCECSADRMAGACPMQH